MWLEERKLPPLDESVLRKAASFVPMLSAEWQMKNDPENGVTGEPEDMFRYDGKFAPNPAVPGSWTAVATVATIDEFKPVEKPNPGRAPIRKIIFQEDGLTTESRYIWSGDMLMDLESNAALRITPRTIEDADYLFIESGGFGPKNPAGWTSPLMVLKRD